MKWRITILTKAGIFYSCFCFSQNLVPNPSFEDYINCPSGQGQLYQVFNWFNPTDNTPDYYNACYISGMADNVDVPINFLGHQDARTGNAYAGFATKYSPSNLREHIETRLSDTLEGGKKYCVEFYVSLADSMRLATDNIGLYLSVDSIFSHGAGGESLAYLPYIPQIESPTGNVISDKENWTLISGEYIASGGERFITIGNFRTNANTTIDTVIPDSTPGIWWNMAYYYIDDVSVYCCDAGSAVLADAGNSQTICLGDSVAIGTPAISGCSYQWQIAEGLTDTANAQPLVFPQATTTYYLTVTDTTQGSCKGLVKDSVTITVVDFSPMADMGSDISICEGESAVIGTTAINDYEYNWQPGMGLNDSNIAQPTASPAQTIIYFLTVQDTGNYCPSVQDSVLVTIQDCDTIEPPTPKPNSVFLPNIFSPNGDGYNDFFRVRGENITEGDLNIYNRWGERIYELKFTSEDLNAVGKWWDGTYKGKNLNTGVFVYFLKITFEDGSKMELKGNVTLVR